MARDGGHLRLAKTGRGYGQRFEHGLQIEGRAADDLEHVGGGGLLLQQFTQFTEQPRVLDGDDGLGGEVRHQLDLLVGERPYLLAENVDGADQLVVLEHWNGEYAAIAAKFDRVEDEWMTVDVGLRCLDVGDVSDLFGDRDTAKRYVRRWPDWPVRKRLDISGRPIVVGNRPESVAVAEEQGAELGPADAHRIFQHGLKNRLKLAGRARDHSQHLRRGGLLLQQFAQFAEQPRVLDGDDGLGGEVFYQIDLLVGEPSDLLAINGEHADHFAVLQHRHADQGAGSRKLDRCNAQFVAERRRGPDIVDLIHLFGIDNFAESNVRPRAE